MAEHGIGADRPRRGRTSTRSRRRWRRAPTSPTASRTSTSAARRCSAPPPRTTPCVAVVTDAERLRRRCSPSIDGQAAAPTARCRAAARAPRPSRAPRPTTPRSSGWLARRARRGAARARRAVAGRARADAALRREPAPVGGVLPRRPARPGRRDRARSCRARSCRYNNLNDTDAAFELVAEFAGRSAAVRDHQARQPLRRRARRRRSPTAYRAALALRPALGLRRHRRAEPPARRRDRARRSPRSSPRS